MTALAELGLTPTQYAEVEAHDPEHIDAWLHALDQLPRTVKSPTGWFLAGIRTGGRPGDSTDAERTKQVHLAERYLANAGIYEPSEEAILDALFGDHGRLKQWAHDQQIRTHFAELWARERPRAERAEREQLKRAERWVAAHAAPSDPEPVYAEPEP